MVKLEIRSRAEKVVEKLLAARLATLCRLGLGLGLGHPRVTLGSRKGHPSATQGPSLGEIGQVLCLQQEVEKWGEGEENRRDRA